MNKRFTIDSVSVPKPCSEDWDKMSGDEKKRFCGSCGKDVYNLSAISRRSAAHLLKKSGGKICVRFARLPNGQTITADRPLYQVTRRAGHIAAGLIATTLSVTSVAYSQGAPMLRTRPEVDETTVTQVEVVSDIETTSDATSQLRIVVLDHVGVPIPNAEVTLTGVETKRIFRTKTDASGYANFVMIPIGVYEMRAKSEDLIQHKQTLNISMAVEPDFEVYLKKRNTAGYSSSTEMEFPLFARVAENDLDAVRAALNNGFDPNKKDSNGQTALYFAVYGLKYEMVKLLVRHGADVNIKTEDDETLITLLAEDVGEGEEAVGKILEFLISKGVDINAKNDSGETMLMEAAYYNDPEVVEILLAAGADTTLVDEDKETAYAMIEDEPIRAIFHKYGIFK